jgi:RNA polymerase sigma-70 factor, ECF subfamily
MRGTLPIMPGASRPEPGGHILGVAQLVKPSPAPLEDAFSLSDKLEGFLRRRGHGDESRDLVQDLFVVLLSKGDGLVSKEPGRFRSFLFAIAYRLGANATRRRRREPACPEGAAERLVAVGEPSPERAVLLKENVRRAAAALDALSPEMRTTLLLVADEGRSTKDVAVLTGVSEEVVRARLSRGRKRLAAILEGKEEP